MRATAEARIDQDRVIIFNPPRSGVLKAAYRWALAEAQKMPNSFPKKRNIGGYIFQAYPTMMQSGADGHIHVEALCIGEPRLS